MIDKFAAEEYERKTRDALREMSGRLDEVDIMDVPENMTLHEMRKEVLLDYVNHECITVDANARKLIMASPSLDGETPARWNALREQIADYVSGRMQT